jgi:superfamily II DNA or RNA helicase
MSEDVSTYLGSKGYTIYKECLTLEDQKFIRNKLSVKPYIPKSPIQPKAFPVYREGNSKFYIPKYFGVEHFGDPDKNKIKDGDKIDIPFNGQLRDYQKPIVKSYIKSTKNSWGGGGLLDIPCGYGKCHGKDTKIMMFDGTIKLVQDIVVGDKLMGDDNTPRNVLSLARGRERLYKIVPENGDTYTVNESHILSLKAKKTSKYNNKGDIIDICLKKYLRLPDFIKDDYCGYRVPLSFKRKSVITDPYEYGKYVSDKYNDAGGFSKDYKYNERQIQLALIAGIIDTIGCKYLHGYYIDTNNIQIMNDIVFICRSIGLGVITNYNKTIYIYGENIRYIPLKKVPMHDFTYNYKCLEVDISITKLGIDNYYGFALDGNHRYLLGDFQVTHNTAMGLYIASILKQKTLVIVHKSFLLNQWIERIREFVPSARVGKIQGQIIDIDDKDIVIGMLQSLSMKEYPEDMFSCFGLTIVDECHHISSEVFSRSLTKIITKYTLGLSATMKRKDGLSHVFKMFLGDIVCSVKRKSEDGVLVKKIDYDSNDDDFKETVYDYRGNPQYSTMITKLCNFNNRTEFILKVIKKELSEKKDQQIMVLGQNKSILKYIHDAVEHRNIATVGYYVGGMKEKDLKLSELKEIVVATYAMAAEGLDIKTLTTLMLVTPRTDITQAVGRILRVKHERPLVVDFVDTHDVFQRQWKKRLKFYQKNNYKIIESDNVNYMKGKWNDIIKKKRGRKKKDSPEARTCMVSIK